MKLKRIYFEAFRSLQNKELEITLDCLGFVGTNESGKSNVLTAINVLSGNRSLLVSDAPKMDKSLNPSLKFKFKLDDKETKEFTSIISEWRKNNTLIKNIVISDLNIFYHIRYDKQTNEEKRYFTVEGLKLDADCLILSYDKLSDSYKLKNGEEYIALDKAIIIKPANVQADEKYRDNFKEIEKLSSQIAAEEKEIASLQEQIVKASTVADGAPSQNSEGATPSPEGAPSVIEMIDNKAIEISLKEQLATKEKTKVDLIAKKQELEGKVSGFNLKQIINEINSSISDLDSNIQSSTTQLDVINEKMKALAAVAEPTEEQKNELTSTTNQQIETSARIETLKKQLSVQKNRLNELQQPVREKYTTEFSELHKHIASLVQTYLATLLPKVVFWEYSPNYILKSQTLYSDITDKPSLNEISRPLVNLFRIGLGVKSIEDLKQVINTIQNDGNERSRLDRTINKKVNEFIKNAWKDYDQSIHISLEHERIRVEIYDPKREEDASHYNMEERSQGCQTFLSFLLTIGAEANQGVLKNNILLLDEPETHLHPSGVRFMLQELIKISERGNIVLYATHSIYLIDRNKFDRHIIVKKEKENTIFQPSNVGRVGYFMQEEVLYRTLDTRLDSDFSFANAYNFVFEGDGDVNLFECFYDKVLAKDEDRSFPLKSTSFHQGGKCSDIKKFFSQRPIQLGTKWIFILDKDSPADELRKFLEGRYKNYLNTDIFIFQYKNPDKNVNDLEFEDLLSIPFITTTYSEAAKSMGINLNEKEFSKHITTDTLFKKYDEAILKNHIPEDKAEDFAIKFKETLNSRIKKQIDGVNTAENFKTFFPEYLKWVEEIKGEIDSALEEE